MVRPYKTVGCSRSRLVWRSRQGPAFISLKPAMKSLIALHRDHFGGHFLQTRIQNTESSFQLTRILRCIWTFIPKLSPHVTVGLWQLVGFLAVGWFGQTQMPVFLPSRNWCNLQSNLSFEWNVAIRSHWLWPTSRPWQGFQHQNLCKVTGGSP